MNYRCLGLIYTKRCTAECDICGFACSPLRTEKMNLDDAKRYITEAYDTGLSIVGISGGEPMLYLDEMYEIIKHARSYGMRVTMTSNCFWAKTYKETYDILLKLQEFGLRHIKISCDEFHNKHVPYENIKQVLKVAKEIEFLITIGCTVLRNKKNLSGVLKEIGQVGHNYNFREHACYPLGRAEEKFMEDEFYYTDKLNKSCYEKSILTILPNGDTYPCGSMCGLLPIRLVGNANDQTINELVDKAINNKHTTYIANNGVLDYHDYLIQNNLSKGTKEQFVDECHACYYLFKYFTEEELNVVNEYIVRKKQEIL